jgi:hypothetical protein
MRDPHHRDENTVLHCHVSRILVIDITQTKQRTLSITILRLNLFGLGTALFRPRFTSFA